MVVLGKTVKLRRPHTLTELSGERSGGIWWVIEVIIPSHPLVSSLRLYTENISKYFQNLYAGVYSSSVYNSKVMDTD